MARFTLIIALARGNIFHPPTREKVKYYLEFRSVLDLGKFILHGLSPGDNSNDVSCIDVTAMERRLNPGDKTNRYHLSKYVLIALYKVHPNEKLTHRLCIFQPILSY